MTVIINGTTGIDTVQDGIVTDGKLNLTANSQEIKDALNASGSAPVYACRAWVNFNGTGTVAIRASGNVSSITDNGTGDYTVNFTTAMPDGNYSLVTMSNKSGTADAIRCCNFITDLASPMTSSCRISHGYVTGNPIDSSIITIAIFR
jgi:hypothetical protein